MIEDRIPATPKPLAKRNQLLRLALTLTSLGRTILKNNSRRARAMRFPTKLCGVLLCSLLSGTPSLPAQTSLSAPAARQTTASDSSYPEQAYLSASRYVNQYF